MKAQKKDPKYVIVRCSQAGVHAGELVSQKGQQVVLRNARRLWRWWSRFTLSDLAVEGPRQDKLSDNRYSTAVPEITLTEACEVIACTPAGAAAIRAVPDGNR